MAQTIYLAPNDPTCAIAKRAFPSYNGQKYRVTVTEAPISLTSCWQDGSRDYYQVVRLADMQQISIPENGSGYTAVDRAYGPFGLPLNLPAAGYAVVEHSISCGKDMGLTIYVHPYNATAMLPAPAELTWAEKVVLVATRSLKSSYAGISDYRFVEANRETGITRLDWDTAKQALIARGMLNKQGAIQISGKNAVGSTSLWNLRRSA